MKSSEFITESPLMQRSIDNINKHGYKVIEQVDIGNHVLILIRDPQNNYHLGFTRADKDFTDYATQNMRHDTDGKIKTKKIASVIKHWVSEYKRLLVSSDSIKRIYQYQRIFGLSDVNVQSDSINGHPVLIITESSGYIPSEKEKNDPRFKTALTKDVRPDSIKKNTKAFGFKTSRAGIPPLLRK